MAKRIKVSPSEDAKGFFESLLTEYSHNVHDCVHVRVDHDPYCVVYIGTVMSVDPCGRYHHFLCDNPDESQYCYEFWEALYELIDNSEDLIELPSDDPCDFIVARRIGESKYRLGITEATFGDDE